MDVANRRWWAYAAPVGLSMGTLAGLNALWFLEPLSGKAKDAHFVLVYMMGGSGLALLLMWRALRSGRLTKRDIGLDLSGWKPARRILGTTMIVVVGYGMYANLELTLPVGVIDAADYVAEDADTNNPDLQLKIVQKPSWGNFCFWFVMLLAASLAELLVFIGVGFCMIERGLQQRGMSSWKATTLAAVFASFMFGIYHFTHAPSWWSLAFIPLIPVMLINVVCFILTRNFYLTLGLHATFSAVGMTQVQYLNPSTNPADLQGPAILAPALVSFAIPFLVLHWLEMQEYEPSE